MNGEQHHNPNTIMLGKVLYLGFERMNKRMKLENPECTRKMQQAGECRIDSNGEQHHNPNTKRMKVLGTFTGV